MLARLNQNIEELESWIKWNIPKSDFVSKTTTFHIPDLGSGQLARIIVKILREMGHSDSNIAKRVSGSSSDILTLLYFKSNTYDCLGTYENESVFKDIKFDWIIATPEIVNNETTSSFITYNLNRVNKGCIVMINTKPILDKANKKANKELQKILSMHLSKLIFVSPLIFGKETLQLPLGICNLSKTKQGKEILVLNSMSSETSIYNNLYDITEYGNDSIFFKLRAKYTKYCNKMGSLRDIINKDNKRYKFSLPARRGHVGNTSFYGNDFYSFYSMDGNIHGMITTTLPDVTRKNIISVSNPIEMENIVKYLGTDFAKFGLSLRKYDTTQMPSTFELVPLFNFTTKVTENRIKKELELTQTEINWIKRKMKKYI